MIFLRDPYSVRKVLNTRRKFDNGNEPPRKGIDCVRGIGDRDPDLAIEHMDPTKYTQHNPHACDGIAE
jgi:hypothetical protein